MRGVGSLVLIAAALSAASALAQGAAPALETTMLRPGRAPSPPPAQVVIDISEQEMTVAVGGVTLDHWKVSTGRRVHWTPTGVFHPQSLSRNHRSSLYDDAPMPFSVFFNGNLAIHGTTAVKRLGRRASHGCVRLHPANARRLFEIVRALGFGNVEIQVRD